MATIVDLEAAAQQGAGAGAAEEVVPAHQVRRLTTTLVDILRSMTPNSSPPGPGGAGLPGTRELGEGSALLGDCGRSEVSSVDDKLSMGSSSMGAPPSARDSEISAATALLKAQYLPQPDYRGDDVRPFYLDKARRGGGMPPAFDDGLPTPGGSSEAPSDASDDAYTIPKKFKKKTRISWTGLAVFLFFCGSLITYVGIRASKTLGLGGSLWYGIIVLVVEVLGGLAMLPYGLCLVVGVVGPPPAAVEAAAKGQAATTEVAYHVRVVIPCYKEPLDVITKTFMASLYAALPANWLGLRAQGPARQ